MRQRLGNALHHAVGIAERLVVPEAQDATTERLQERSSTGVVPGAKSMLTAGELYHELRLAAAEVDDVGTDRELAGELRAEEPAVAEPGPETALRIGLAPAQPSRVVAGRFADCTLGPLTLPSPRRGEGM